MSSPTPNNVLQRVADYVRTVRYPAEILAVVKNLDHFRAEHIVADMAPAPGVLRQTVPRFRQSRPGRRADAEMRAAGKNFWALPELQKYCGLREATTLPSDSVDFVAAGQAFPGSNIRRAQ